MTVVHGSCHHDCPDTCVWDVTVNGGVAVQLRGNTDHPTTRGQLCPKVNRFLARVYHPERLRTPLRRTGPKGAARFEPTSWDDALDEIASRLGELRRGPGPESILQFSFDGTQGVIQKGIMADRFFDAVGASDIRRHLCGVTAWLGAADVTGLPLGIDPEDLEHSRLIVLWGTNTLVTNRHLWPTIQAARERGARVVVVDPLRTATAAAADQHLQLQPGSDVALVGAMLHVIEREGLLDAQWLHERTEGWESLRQSVHDMTPSTAAALTGLDPTTIERFAREYATSQPAAIRVLVGPEHHHHGREIMRAIATLPAVTGAWRHRGGGLARSTQVYFEEALNYPANRPARRSFNMAGLGQVLTDRELEPQIQALFVHNSNPAVICPDQNRVIEGLRRDDLFTVVSEQFMTETAAHADIVLPATTQLEHLDLGIAWGHLYLSLNQPAIEPVGEALPNTEMFRRLAARMGLDGPGLDDSDETMIRQLLESEHQWLGDTTYELLEEATWVRLEIPAGYRPHIDAEPSTPQDRFTLHPLSYRDSHPPTPAHPLRLASPKQHTKFLNSNYAAFAAHHPPEGAPTVFVHPTDAANRRITDGDMVRVHNQRGQLTVAARLSTDVLPGNVAVPFGWWMRHSPEDRSVNVLTDPSVPADGQGSAAFSATYVEVTAVRDE